LAVRLFIPLPLRGAMEAFFFSLYALLFFFSVVTLFPSWSGREILLYELFPPKRGRRRSLGRLMCVFTTGAFKAAPLLKYLTFSPGVVHLFFPDSEITPLSSLRCSGPCFLREELDGYLQRKTLRRGRFFLPGLGERRLFCRWAGSVGGGDHPPFPPFFWCPTRSCQQSFFFPFL